MTDEIHLTLSRADAELIADLADTGLDRETSFPSMDGFTPAYRAELDRLREDGQRVIKLLDAALAAPAAGPERAATGELEALIAECEAHSWGWRLERVCIDDAPDSCVLTRIASVKPLAWQGERFDDTDEDGWIGLSDTDADGSITDLLRETMRWANERTNIHARVNRAAIGGGGEG